MPTRLGKEMKVRDTPGAFALPCRGFIWQEHVTRVCLCFRNPTDSVDVTVSTCPIPRHVLQPLPAVGPVGLCPLLLAHPTGAGLGGSPAEPDLF